MRKSAAVLLSVVLFAWILPWPVGAQIFEGRINMAEDAGKYQSLEFSDVFFRTYSVCWDPNRDGRCTGETLWMTTGSIERKSTWPSDDALLYGHIHVTMVSANKLFPSQSPIYAGQIAIYKHCPLDGTNDGRNNVGWNEYVDGTFVYAYQTVQWDIPNTMTNHVWKSGSGATLSNDVYSTRTSLSFWDASAWRWAVGCNTVKATLGTTRAQVHLYAHTWDIEWRVFWWDHYHSYPERYFYVYY